MKYTYQQASCDIEPFEEEGASNLAKNKVKWIRNLFVEPEYRRKGLATKMLQQISTEADATQISLIVEVRPYIEDSITQEALEALYKRNQFVKIQDEPLLMMRIAVPASLMANLNKKPTSQIITNLYAH